MTGFGRSEFKSSRGLIRVEMKTVNHKFFEISLRLPNHLAEFEDSVRKSISQEIRRGKINLYISSPDPSVASSRLVLNEALAKEVLHKIHRLKKVLKLNKDRKTEAHEQSMVLREVLRYPDVLTKDLSYHQQTSFYRDLEKALSVALQRLKSSRLLEGASIEKDLRARLSEMEKSLRAVEKRIPALNRAYKKTLEGKMKEFLRNGEIDQARLTQEVAQYAKNSDISEEVTRLKSHLAAMRKTLKENGELGRKIDFIAQEMTRESNTMGAKSSDVAIANLVIQIKSSIEKIREQAQNVE